MLGDGSGVRFKCINRRDQVFGNPANPLEAVISAVILAGGRDIDALKAAAQSLRGGAAAAKA